MQNKKYLLVFAIIALAFIFTGNAFAKTYVCFKTLGRCLENFKYSVDSPACRDDLSKIYAGSTDGICYTDQTTCVNACKGGSVPGKKYYVCKPSTANPTIGTCEAHKKNGTDGAYATKQACTDALKTDYATGEVKGSCYEEAEYDTCRRDCGDSGATISYSVCVASEKKCELHKYTKYPNTEAGKTQCTAEINNSTNYKGLAKGACYLPSELNTTCATDCASSQAIGKPGICVVGKGCELHKFADKYIDDLEWCQIMLTADYGSNITNGTCYANADFSTDPNNTTLKCNKDCKTVDQPKKIGICLKDSGKCVEHVRADFFKNNVLKCTDYLKQGIDYVGVKTTAKCYTSDEMKAGGTCETDCKTGQAETWYICNKTSKTCELNKVQSYANSTDCKNALASLYPNNNLTTDRCYTKTEFDNGTCGKDCGQVTPVCKKQDESANSQADCCAGLKFRICSGSKDASGNCTQTTCGICDGYCGDNICGNYVGKFGVENECTCPTDCKPSGSIGSKNVLIITKTLATRPKTSFIGGLPGMLDTTSAEFSGYNFTVQGSLLGNLDSFDTIVYMLPSVDDLLTDSERNALEAWIKKGNKFIRFANNMADMDNKEWTFSDLTTYKANVNAGGAKTLTPFKILEENALASSQTAQNSFVDVSKMAYQNEIEAFGSSKIWPYKDIFWCNSATHASNPGDDGVLVYRPYGNGLIIYNGIYFGTNFGSNPKPGTDILASNITKLWLNSLRFDWKSQKLACSKPIASNAVLPTPKKNLTTGKNPLNVTTPQFDKDYSPKVVPTEVEPLGNFVLLCGTVDTGLSKEATILFEYWNNANPAKKFRIGKKDVTSNDTFCQPVFDLAVNAKYSFVFRAYNGAGLMSSSPVEFTTKQPTADELEIIKQFKGK